MTVALTSEQVNQVVSNTTLVLLVRPDLMPEWRDNLMDLLRQARTSDLHEEAIFVSAVLALLHSPNDTLPTGTTYDYAWQAILTGLQTGVPQPAAGQGEQGEQMTLDRLLNSVAEAVIAVMTQVPQQKDAVADELREMRAAAVDGEVPDLVDWIDDLLALLDGTPSGELGEENQGVYGAYWRLIVRSIDNRERNNEAHGTERSTMRRLLIAMIGFGMLVVGVAALWIARGPQATEARTTGGVLYTQQEVAQPWRQSRPGCYNSGRGQVRQSYHSRPSLHRKPAPILSFTDQGEIDAAPEITAILRAYPATCR